MNPIGEKGKRAFRVNYNSELKLGFHGTTISSDAGLLVYRKLDDALGLTANLEAVIDEPRMENLNLIHRSLPLIVIIFSKNH